MVHISEMTIRKEMLKKSIEGGGCFLRAVVQSDHSVCVGELREEVGGTGD